MPSEAITETVADVNLKTVGEMPSESANLLRMAAVRDFQAWGEIVRATVSRCVDRILDTTPVDATAVQKVLSGNDTAAQLAQLLAALSSGQQQAKVAQTTPPPTS